MKNRTLIFLCSLLLLTSCGSETNEPTSLIPSEEPTETPSEVVPTLEPTLDPTSEPTSNEPSKDPILDDWDEQTLKYFNYILGEGNKLPFVRNKGFESKVGKQDDINFVQVDFYGINSDSIIDTYSTLLEKDGYYLTHPNEWYQGAKEVNLLDDVFVQYRLIDATRTEPEHLSVIAYKITSRTKDWPTQLLNTMFFESVPRFKAEAYQINYYFDQYSDTFVFDAYCYNYEENSFKDYETTLSGLGYVYSLNNGDYFYTAGEKLNSNLEIMLMNYDSINKMAFMRIKSNNKQFPNFMFENTINTKLPVLEGEGISYSYYETENKGEFNEYTSNKYLPTLNIYGVKQDISDTYLTSLIDAGWSNTSENIYEIGKNTGNEHQLFVIYGAKYEQLVIFVLK